MSACSTRINNGHFGEGYLSSRKLREAKLAYLSENEGS